jgi:hypothetical protein
MSADTFVVLFFVFHFVLPVLIAFTLYLWKGYHR